MALSIDRLSFEHHPDGFGIGVTTPRLTWHFASSGLSDWSQTSYDIEVKRDNGTNVEEHHVESDESVLVKWPSTPLTSREQVRVRVRANGKCGDSSNSICSDFSQWHTVEGAFFDSAKDWTARPICPPSRTTEDAPLRPVRFRKEFQLPSTQSGVGSARLYITSYGVYEAFLNGQRVGDFHMAPGWQSYHHRLHYQIYDVTDMLVKNRENVLAVEVAEGWYLGRLGFHGGKKRIWGEDLAVLAQLEVSIRGSDSGRFVVSTDESWKCHESALVRSEIYDGEDYDTREEMSSWTSSRFEATSEWSKVKSLPFPTVKLVAPDTPPVRVTEEVSAVEVFTTEGGKKIIDFGQNLVGKLQIQSIKGPSGHKLTFTHAEVMENGELGIRPLRVARCQDSIILDGSRLEDWSPKFTFHGFRYVQVDGWTPSDGSEAFAKEEVKALVMHTDMRRTGTFSCSRDAINQLHRNAVWGMRGNFLSVPTDCPQRDERLGWTGDICVFSETANFLYDTQGMLGNWLEDFSAEHLEDKRKFVPPLVVPDVIDSRFSGLPSAIWDDCSVLLPFQLYTSSGDKEVLRRQYESSKAWITKGVVRGEDNLWDPKAWQLGDWLDPAAPPDNPGGGRTDGTYVADAYLVYTTSILAQISSILGETADEKHFSSESTTLKSTFQDKYIAPLGRVVCDTQTALALAIKFSLFKTPQQLASAGLRLADLVKNSRFRIATGFAGTPAILPALSLACEHQLAYRMLLEKNCPSWMYPITMGATTIWERWDSMTPDGKINEGEMTSFNHYALGAVLAWVHERVGGIRPLSPGWKTIRIAPIPGGPVTHAEIAYDGPYGKVECSWKLTGEASDRFEMKFVVPPNSRAWVVMPEGQRTSATQEGGAEEAVDGGEKGQWFGSGSHSLECGYTVLAWPPRLNRPDFAPPVQDDIA